MIWYYPSLTHIIIIYDSIHWYCIILLLIESIMSYLTITTTTTQLLWSIIQLILSLLLIIIPLIVCWYIAWKLVLHNVPLFQELFDNGNNSNHKKNKKSRVTYNIIQPQKQHSKHISTQPNTNDWLVYRYGVYVHMLCTIDNWNTTVMNI